MRVYTLQQTGFLKPIYAVRFSGGPKCHLEDEIYFTYKALYSIYNKLFVFGQHVWGAEIDCYEYLSGNKALDILAELVLDNKYSFIKYKVKGCRECTPEESANKHAQPERIVGY